MPGYLLDTNIVSASRKRDPAVMRWLAAHAGADSWLSVVTIGELQRGVSLKRRKDPAAAIHLAAWLRLLRSEYVTRLIEVDERVALEWGRIGALRTRGEADSLIAATAAIHQLTLVTRNTADFADTDISLVNPWKDA
jgi:toxin FitB